MATPSYHASKRVLGAGIVLTGLVILAIGLIIGIEFPNYLANKSALHLCVTSRTSVDYEDWVHDRARKKYNRLYFMDLINPHEFLQERESPKFRRRGPYVFEESERKTNIVFTGSHVHFRPWIQQKFLPDVTAAECGRLCSAADKITVINPAFLQLIQPFIKESYFYLALLPRIANAVRPKERKINSSLVSPTPWKTTMRVPSHPQLMDFDSWLQRSDTPAKEQVLADIHEQQISPSELLALYDTLNDRDKYGLETLLNDSIECLCEELYNETSTVWEAMGNDANVTTSLLNCGISFLLRKFSISSSLHQKELLTAALGAIFCTNATGHLCWYVNSVNDVELQSAYLTVIYQYLIEYVLNTVKRTLRLRGPQLLASLSVTKLALGYSTTLGAEFLQGLTKTTNSDINDSNPITNQKFFIRGFLMHYNKYKDVLQDGHQVTLKTCLWDKKLDHNLYFEALKGESSWLPPHIQSAGGLTEKVPSDSKLYACQTPQPPSNSFRFFVPDLFRGVKFSTCGSDTFDGVSVVIYQPDATGCSSLQKLQSLSSVVGYLRWACLPSPTEIIREFPKHSTNNLIAVEPLSGRVWWRTSLVQLFVGIRLPSGGESVNLSSYKTPIPFGWIRRESAMPRGASEHFKEEFQKLMSGSCGGLIGLAIIGSVIILVGCGVAYIERPSIRVGPEERRHGELDSF